MKKYLIVLTGPTGIGKTCVGIEVAKHFNTEIISADSRQLYKELSIGTAVPSPPELSDVKHHFVQSFSINENLNASKFESLALNTLETLFENHEIVLMVGGSMLYVDAVCKGIDLMPDVEPEVRESLKTKLDMEGLESLRFQLKRLDPEYYETVDLKNPNRIIHALEICLVTGKPYSSFRLSPNRKRPFEIIKIGLDCERETLHQHINRRVDKMVEAGLEDEARKLYPLKHLNALNTVGYREWFAHFDGEISREKAIELIKRNSRRYARKQLTWFRNDAEINWFQPSETSQIIKFIENKIG